MKYLFYFSAVIVILSCVRPPELDTVPKISFENIAFRNNTNAADEIILDIYFEDGDGDLGLHPQETYPPYNERFVITDDFGDFYVYPGTDTFPDFNTQDWLVRRDPANNNTIVDTIYAPINPDHFNIFITFYTIENGNKVLFDFNDELGVSGYNGRFPILFDNLESQRTLEGNLRYSMQSTGWLTIFSIDSLELEVQIQDRALNKSNVISTPRFTLTGIQVN